MQASRVSQQREQISPQRDRVSQLSGRLTPQYERPSQQSVRISTEPERFSQHSERIPPQHEEGPDQRHSSLPNLKAFPSSRVDMRKLYSLSLSHIKAYSELEYTHKPCPFSLRWLYGYNTKAGVINLNDKGSTTAFYAATNCAIIYNWTTNHMRILQGHRHMVCFLDCDAKGKWLVTADSGPENVIIVWDSEDYFPQRTLFNPHGPTRLAKVSLSPDGKYLLSIAYSRTGLADIFWWIWSYGLETPHARITVEGLQKDSVIQVEFNTANSLQFLLLTKHDIWIGVCGKVFIAERGIIKETDEYEIKLRYVERIVHADYGKLTCFTFVNNTNQIIVATSRGAVMIYGYTLDYQRNAEAAGYENLRFVKPLKIEKYKINVIKSIDGLIVTGNNHGEIHFYDEQMKLVYWLHEVRVDSVTGLSFNRSPRSYQVFDPCCKPCLCWEKVKADIDSVTGLVRQKLLKEKLPTESTTEGKPFIIRDFIICTLDQGVGFVDFVTEKLHNILDNKTSPALALTVHPDKPLVCIGYENGNVEMFNFLHHKLFKRLFLREFYKVVVPPKDDSINCNFTVTIPKLSVTSMKYSPSGHHLACGLNTGQLLFLDPTTLEILTPTPHHDTKHAIREINYSLDSLTMVFSDVGKTVCVYKYDCVDFKWSFVGKHRSHYKDISAVFFLPLTNEYGDFKLLSLGTDRIMVEYDVGNSGNDYLDIYSLDRIDQTAVPLAGMPWPNLKGLDEKLCRTDHSLILIANDEFKYKIINVATTMTLSTVLGPRFEHPVSKMELITKVENNVEYQYILFATKNIIGLQKMPLDGNPWKHVGLLGHPIQVTQMCFRQDLGILFTIGAKDSVMSQWAANYRSVEQTTKQGGGDLDPYYCLIENGRPGWLFQEIRDLFYYIQILCQGTFSPAMRRVKDFIPIDSLPDLMRALGFFPSEYEVENLIVEAKYKVYLREPDNEIDFEEFVKLYLNHRPAFGFSLKKIRNAFHTFAIMKRNAYTMSRNDFLKTLSNYGECFEKELSWYLLSILAGHSFEDRDNMLKDDFTFLPNEITFTELITNIMGIQEFDNVSEQRSIPESIADSRDTSSLDSLDY